MRLENQVQSEQLKSTLFLPQATGLIVLSFGNKLGILLVASVHLKKLF